MNKSLISKLVLGVAGTVLIGLIIGFVVTNSTIRRDVEKERSALGSICVSRDSIRSRLAELESMQTEQQMREVARREEKNSLKLSHFVETWSDNTYSFRDDIDRKLKSIGFKAGPTRSVGSGFDPEEYDATKTVFERTLDGNVTKIIVIDYGLLDGDFTEDILIEFDSEEAKQAFIDDALKMVNVSQEGSSVKVKSYIQMATGMPLKIRINDSFSRSLPKFI